MKHTYVQGNRIRTEIQNPMMNERYRWQRSILNRHITLELGQYHDQRRAVLLSRWLDDGCHSFLQHHGVFFCHVCVFCPLFFTSVFFVLIFVLFFQYLSLVNSLKLFLLTFMSFTFFIYFCLLVIWLLCQSVTLLFRVRPRCNSFEQTCISWQIHVPSFFRIFFVQSYVMVLSMHSFYAMFSVDLVGSCKANLLSAVYSLIYLHNIYLACVIVFLLTS